MELKNIKFISLIALLFSSLAHSRDIGQWQDSSITKWYKELMRPDFPTSSCCGEADAYWADEFHVKDGKTFVTITDDRDDLPLKRPHIPNGTIIEIPDNKLKWDKSNPTGHGILFVGFNGTMVFCYVQSSGI